MNPESSQRAAPMVKIEKVCKHFDGVDALVDVDLVVERGDVIVVIGPSGSGKSTLLRCINGLELIDSGGIWVGDAHVTHFDTDLDQVRRKIGMVFQQFNLFPHLSVLDNVNIAQIKVLRRAKEEATEISIALLKKVGIPEKAPAYPAHLSGGQQQRVAIARALAMHPDVMLFDEPTSALDAEMVNEVLDVMRRLGEEGMTMIVVSHEMGFARDVADHVAFLERGQVVEHSPKDVFFTAPREARTRTFLRSLRP